MFIYVNQWPFYNHHNTQSSGFSGNDEPHDEFSGKSFENRYRGKSSKELLDTYLKDACSFMEYKSKYGAFKVAKKFLNKEDVKKELLGKINEADIAKKEKELKAQAKAAPFKAKVNYALNTEALSYSASAINMALAPLPGMAVLISGGRQESLAVVLAGAATMVGGLIAAYKIPHSTEAKNPKEEKAIDDYYAVKHSLVALKQLKKAIRKENGSSNMQMAQRFLAEGYGNPYDTTPAILKQKANSR